MTQLHEMDQTSEKYFNITLADYVKDLSGNDSRLHKEAVIAKAFTAAELGAAQGEAFLYNAYLTYNPYITFGVKQVPETKDITGQVNPWPKFWRLALDLSNRALTGHAARDMIQEVSQDFDSEEWNLVCRPVLIKDLRCGISDKTLNKILGKSDWKIPVFSCQLAQDSEEHVNKMTGVKRIEGKLDGVRVLAIISAFKDSVVLCSRNGKEFHNFPQIKESLIKIKDKLPFLQFGESIVLDGEITGKSFQELMKQAQRKSDVETKEMIYNIFDFVPLEDFSNRGFWNAQQRKRTNWLEQSRSIFESEPSLKVTPGILVDLDTSTGHDIMRRYAEDAIENNLEGIMIKDWEAPYECKRSSFWMKWKPTITVDLNIVGYEEGTGRNAGRLGAFICEGIDSNRNIRVNVGSGFSDDDRTSYWKHKDNLNGQVVEVMADAVTQNQDGTYSLRFPRFVRFRGFEPGEKI